MASTEVTKIIKAEPERPQPPSRRSSTDSSSNESFTTEDARTVTEAAREKDSDSISISSTASYPDNLGRRIVTLADSEISKTVYEAWEITYSDDTMEWNTWNVFCGINFGVKWKSLDDGHLYVSPLPSYGQGELEDMHEDAIRQYEAKGRKKGKSYNQDIANRVFKLDLDIYKRLQALIDDKQRSTNRMSYHRREWRVVVFEAGEYQITDALPERKKSLIRRRRKQPQVQRWFFILRGEEVKSTKEDGGWRLFNRFSNPWWRADAHESRSERLEHREHAKLLQQRNARAARFGPPLPPPPPPPLHPPVGSPVRRPLPPPGMRR